MSRRGYVPSIALAVALIVAAPPPPAHAQSGTVQSIRYGEITGVRQVTIEMPRSGRSAQTGATVGAVAGYALADGRDRWLGSLVGGAIGGAAGRAAGKAARKKKGWEYIIRLEDSGEEISLKLPGKKVQHAKGDRVRMMSGAGGTTDLAPA
jgi:outer membrane lipoprotein SlyB